MKKKPVTGEYRWMDELGTGKGLRQKDRSGRTDLHLEKAVYLHVWQTQKNPLNPASTKKPT